MKRVKLRIVLISFFMFFVSSPIAAIAGDYLGDICWSIDDGSGDGPTLKLGVINEGGGHYLLLGTLSHSTDGTYIAKGNAEFVNKKVYISVIMADGNNNAMSTLHALGILDSSTLNGSYTMLHSGASAKGETELRYSSGTVTKIPCQ